MPLPSQHGACVQQTLLLALPLLVAAATAQVAAAAVHFSPVQAASCSPVQAASCNPVQAHKAALVAIKVVRKVQQWMGPLHRARPLLAGEAGVCCWSVHMCAAYALCIASDLGRMLTLISRHCKQQELGFSIIPVTSSHTQEAHPTPRACVSRAATG